MQHSFCIITRRSFFPISSRAPNPYFAALHQQFSTSLSKMAPNRTHHSRQTPRRRLEISDPSPFPGYNSKTRSEAFRQEQPPQLDNSDEQIWPSLNQASSSKTKKAQPRASTESVMGSAPTSTYHSDSNTKRPQMAQRATSYSEEHVMVCASVATSSQSYTPVLDTEKPQLATTWAHGATPPRRPDDPGFANQADSNEEHAKNMVPQPPTIQFGSLCIPVCLGDTNSKAGSFQFPSVSDPMCSGNVIHQLKKTDPVHATQADSMAAPFRNGRDGVLGKDGPGDAMGKTTSVGSMNAISELREASQTKESVNYSGMQPVRKAEPTKVIRHLTPGRPKKLVIPQTTKNPAKEYHHRSSSDHIKPFDICQPGDGISRLTSSPLENNKEMRNYFEELKDDPRPSFLRPGMVLLKNYISCAQQIKIVQICRELGCGPGGFYQPCFSNGAKMRLYMMCLGLDWDPQRKSYGEFRFIDGTSPPDIPDEFRKLVMGAIQASHGVVQDDSVMKPDHHIPWMKPDICIVNFYKESGKLGMHQDRDESGESIHRGLPVVSFSLGDSAEFLFGDERDVNKAEKIELKSGDVLIFGGESRLVYHGVTAIIPDSAPKFLANEAHLLPGRLNLTFRKY